jgi:2-methylisocitrate lyase-like PEP mutase family enzyme
VTQTERGTVFRALHRRAYAFIIPNPWDLGTARILAQLGFEALASTSAGYAFSIGRPDNKVGRDRMIAHIATIAGATDLPVSADLENGFGDAAETVAETIRRAAAAGSWAVQLRIPPGVPRPRYTSANMRRSAFGRRRTPPARSDFPSR